MSVEKDYFGGWTVNDSNVRAYWRKKGFLGFCILCFALLVGLGVWRAAQAAELSAPTSVEDLYKEAVALGGYTQFCAGREKGCPMPGVLIATIEDDHIAGQFTWHQPGYIKLHTSNVIPGSLEWNETVVHEFVHYLQWLSGKIGPATPCEGVRDAEMEAYAAGAAYLAKFNVVKDRGFAMFFVQTMCMYG